MAIRNDEDANTERNNISYSAQRQCEDAGWKTWPMVFSRLLQPILPDFRQSRSNFFILQKPLEKYSENQKQTEIKIKRDQQA